jgi:hypothetical protein
VPHWRYVETAADAQALRHVRQVHRQHEDVGYALVTFVLEVVLGEPECVEPQRIHLLGNGLGLLEDGHQLLVGVAAFIRWRCVLSHVRQINVPRVDGHKPGNHCFRRSICSIFSDQLAILPCTARAVVAWRADGLQRVGRNVLGIKVDKAIESPEKIDI